jgi:hypothetical protein
MIAEPPGPETEVTDVDFTHVTPEELADPLWRLGCVTGESIYTIQSKDAKGEDAGPIRFRPTPEQRQVIEAIYIHGWEFLIIPKARQLGMSSVIELIILDALLFSSGVNASIVDKTEDDAQKKLREKVKYAWQGLPASFKEGFHVSKSNDSAFTIKQRGAKQEDECSVSAAVSARGNSNHILHISEWGTIQNQKATRGRSVEILTGALPTAKHPGCIIIIETTWKGGKSGELWPLISAALAARNIPEADKTPKTPRILFFGWQTNPANRMFGNFERITPETHKYCDEMERLPEVGRLDNAQRLWWQETKAEQNIFMSREYPTTMDECFESPSEGAFFCPASLRWQQAQALSLQLKWRNVHIALQGENNEYATWLPIDDPKRAIFMMLEPPRDGESYLLACDPCGRRMATGAKGERDTNAYGVVKAARFDDKRQVWNKAQLVCVCKPDDRVHTPELIYRVLCMHRLYGNCKTVVEINAKDDIGPRMEAAGIRNLWRQETGADGAPTGIGKSEEVIGWYTQGSAQTGGTRKRQLDHLEEQIREWRIVIGLSWIIHQFEVFITDETGNARAADGEHDDFVLFLSIACMTLGSATPYKALGLAAVDRPGPRHRPWGDGDFDGRD